MRKTMRNMICCLPAFVLLAFASGCWDQVEIEKRGFVVGTAIDIFSEEEAAEIANRAPEPITDIRLAVTNQIVAPGREPGTNIVTSKITYNDTAVGDSILEISREMATRRSQSPYYEHLKVILISDEVGRRGKLPDVLDFFLRDTELKRSIQVFVVKGKAYKVLDVKPKSGEMTAMYLTSVANNHFQNAAILANVLLGDLHEFLLLEQSFAMPRIEADSVEVSVEGAAVIEGKSKRIVGFLDEAETVGLNFLTNNVGGGYLDVLFHGDPVVYEIFRGRRYIDADVSDPNRIKFRIKIVSNGGIAEKFPPVNLMDSDTIRELEDKFAGELKKIVEMTLRKLQKELKADPAGLGDFIRRRHPKLWKKIRDDWDHGENYFSKCEIEVETDVEIVRRGTIIKSHKK